MRSRNSTSRVTRFLSRIGRSKKTATPVNTRAYYSQQGTCQIPQLWYLLALFLGEREDGTFVEVGAYDGLFVSNSWGLAVRGWRGLMIEPVPYLALACQRNHAMRPNIEVVETAVGRPSVTSLSLNLAGTLTTANQDVFDEYKSVDWARDGLSESRIVAPCTTLDRLLVSHQIERGFDVLIVDVEGYEGDVFAGFNVELWRPKMMIVELLDTHPDLSSTAFVDSRLSWNLQCAGYRIGYKDCINTVFVREDIWETAFQQERCAP